MTKANVNLFAIVMIFIILLIGTHYANGQSTSEGTVALKGTVTREVEYSGNSIVYSARIDKLAKELMDAYESAETDADAHKAMEPILAANRSWYYGLNIYVSDSEDHVVDMMSSDKEAIFREDVVARASVGTARTEKSYCAIIVAYQ